MGLLVTIVAGLHVNRVSGMLRGVSQLHGLKRQVRLKGLLMEAGAANIKKHRGQTEDKGSGNRHLTQDLTQFVGS